MNRLHWTLCALLVATAAGCGVDESPEPPATESPATPEGVTGSAPGATQGIPAVVTLRPAGDGAVEAPSEPASMDQLGLEFLPGQLMARPGQTLVFSNSESIAHNVHVRYMENDSTVYEADMDPADTAETVLQVEGGYDVTCDVHPGMRGFIFVTSAPYVAFAEFGGSFALGDVPPGPYVASVWSVSPDLRSEQPVEIVGDATRLDLTAP